MKLSLCIGSLFAALAACAPATDKPTSYDGVKVIRFASSSDLAATNKVVKIIEDLSLSRWTSVIKSGEAIDFEVPKEKFAEFKKQIEGISFSVMHEDLGKSIREESGDDGVAGASFFAKDVSAAAVDLSWFNAYHAYADHLTYLTSLVAQFPNNAKIFTAGTSYNGRAITGIHIFGSSGGGKKPASIFHGTVHAREWVTTMTTEYIAYQLLSTYSNTTATKTYVDNNDFYILPVVNPDGFVYTQTNTRLWRKNRQPASSGNCVGTDPNRNWAAHWATTGGASTAPCDETYKGPAANSAPETKALATWQDALQKSQGVKFFIDFHSYSQLLMTPYGWSCSSKPADNTELVGLASGAAAALKAVHGTTYKSGPICNTIYMATGGSVDYSYDTTKVKYSFTYELRDTGNYGFVLPANQIQPVGRETWASVKYLLDRI